MIDTDLDAMALAIAEYARSNNAWPDDIHTIADAFDLLVSSAEAAAGSEHTHDSYYGTRPWPTTNDDFLPHRLRRTAPEPRVFRAGDPEPDGLRAVLDSGERFWQRWDGEWYDVLGEVWPWNRVLYTRGPLVEVHLPTPVTA